MAWVALASAAVSVGGSIYANNQANKAAQKNVGTQQNLAANLKYEPIDIEKLKSEATRGAIENATNALALERQLTPVVADTREAVDRTKLELARQVGSDLALGGDLSADTINRVTNAGRIIGGQSGIGSSNAVPLTASLLGLSSIDLMNQRRSAAGALVGPGTPAPVGLSPGAVASAEVAQNAAYNDFNMQKMGIDANLADAQATARTAQVGGQTGMIGALSNLAFGKQGPMQDGLYGAYTAAQKNRNDAIAGGGGFLIGDG